MTEQNWQCTSLCQACFPSLFIGVQLGTTDCRRHIEIHFTFSPTLAAIANALKCSSAWHREKSLFFHYFLIYLTAELCWGERMAARGFLNTLRQFTGDHEAHYSDPWTSIHNTHKQRLTINMQMMCFGNMICFQRVNTCHMYHTKLFHLDWLVRLSLFQCKKSWMDILDALINFLMLKTSQIQPC